VEGKGPSVEGSGELLRMSVRGAGSGISWRPQPHRGYASSSKSKYWQTSLSTAVTICSSIVSASGVSMCLCARCQRQAIADARLMALAQKCGLVSREGRSLIELGLNLAIELADRPATAQDFAFVERARVSASNCQEPHVVRPREREARRTLLGKRTEQLCRQRLHNSAHTCCRR
jgi:hypothetical protein